MPCLFLKLWESGFVTGFVIITHVSISLGFYAHPTFSPARGCGLSFLGRTLPKFDPRACLTTTAITTATAPIPRASHIKVSFARSFSANGMLLSKLSDFLCSILKSAIQLFSSFCPFHFRFIMKRRQLESSVEPSHFVKEEKDDTRTRSRGLDNTLRYSYLLGIDYFMTVKTNKN
jgi:hypothetical protein